MRIDSHQHYWRYTTDEFGWIDNRMSVIRRDFLPDEFADVLRTNGIDGSIAVQARQTDLETEWLLQLANRYEHIRGVVGWIDLQAGNAADQLVEFARHPKAVGVRHVLHDEPDIHFMLRPQFMAGVRLLSELKLTYDILIFPEHLPNTLRFVSQLSENQTFVVDHVAKPSIKTGKLSPWKEQIRELAAHPNVYCKLSGMVTEANWPNHRTDDFRPFFDAVFEAFGPDRLMFGSDWPVCLVAEEYHRWLARVTEAISVFTPGEQEKIMGLNALKVYQLI